MDISQLSKRTIFITIGIWLAVFLVFFSTAVTLAVTSNPFYSFLVVIGLVASTSSANLYVSESRVRRPFAPQQLVGEQELGSVGTEALPDGQGSVATLRSALVKSEASLCRQERLRGPRQSFSSSWVCEMSSDFVPREVLTTSRSAGTKLTKDETDLQSEQEVEPGHATHDDGTQRPSAESVESQAAGNFQQDIPHFWKESSSKDSNSRPGSSTPAATAPWPSSSMYSKESKLKDHAESLAGSHWEEEAGLLNSCGSFWSLDAVGFPESSQVLYRMPQAEEVWKTPVGSPKESKDRVNADMSFGDSGTYRRGGEASGQDWAPTKGTDSHAAAGQKEAGRSGKDDNRKSKKKSKKFKLIPRFLKGKKKEFTQFI